MSTKNTEVSKQNKQTKNVDMHNKKSSLLTAGELEFSRKSSWSKFSTAVSHSNLWKLAGRLR